MQLLICYVLADLTLLSRGINQVFIRYLISPPAGGSRGIPGLFFFLSFFFSDSDSFLTNPSCLSFCMVFGVKLLEYILLYDF